MDHAPVQTSAVYILGRRNRAAAPPPSPPSPRTAAGQDDALCTPLQEIQALSLDGPPAAVPAAAAQDAHDTHGASSSSGSVSGSGSVSVSVSGSSSVSRTSSTLSTATDPRHHHRPSLASPITTAPATAAASPLLGPADSLAACGSDRLAAAIHVLATEAHALQSVARLYGTAPSARAGFDRAVDAIVRTQTASPPGKLILVGVGKSGYIGRKLAATFNSLAVPASFVHPTEALHGDLGHIRPHDAVLFITFSGKTQELVSLLPHVHPALPLILLTAHVTTETCALVRHRQELHASLPRAAGDIALGPTILLPAPIPVPESVSFGVSAPTTSTTTALAVGDALALVVGNELHATAGGVGAVFQSNHPGGAIGETARQVEVSEVLEVPEVVPLPADADHIRHLAVPWAAIPVVTAAHALCADVLRAGYKNAAARGWVRVLGAAADDDAAVAGTPLHTMDPIGTADGLAPPSRIHALAADDLGRPVCDVAGLVVAKPDFVVVSADTKARSAAQWLRRAAPGNVVIAVVDHANGGALVGVLELDDLLTA